ncbi:MAG TPA: MutS family DNA mismatch repair protein [Chloroflexia bacterium]|nr:MutS family DNA mismatch repair protein [Chloroflexia bacterium]
MSQSLNPKQRRLLALEGETNRLKKRLLSLKSLSSRYSWLRLLIFFAGAALSLTAYGLAGWWFCLPVVALSLVVFVVVAYFHGKLENGIARHQIWLDLKTTEIARMKLDWENIPLKTVSAAPVPGEHPFGIDLDLCGERSIHRLLDTAISREGSQRLRDWLLNPDPDRLVIYRRQALVKELAPLTLFRNKLTLQAALAARDLNEQWEGKKLLSWLAKSEKPVSLRNDLLLLAGFTLLNLILFLLYLTHVLTALWVIGLIVFLFLNLYKMQKLGDLFDNAFTLREGLEQLGAVLHYLETYRYGSNSQLKQLCQPLLTGNNRPSVQLGRISRIAAGASMRKNGIIWLLINALVPWDIYFAHRLNQSKAQLATLLPVWLNIWYELEALSSLASFSHLNPSYSFPEVLPEEQPLSVSQSAVFEGRQLGHPLIPDATKVCNDFSLDGPGRIVIITGSNMAGKSSFLRTLGVNLCLAYAGGPVNAAYLQTSLFRVFSCIRVNDSVTDGYSYFYAEVRRLKRLLDELDQPDVYPLFYLIDEIFRGTNNRERLLGSRAYLRSLVGRNGQGVVSTHDLELVRLADEMPQISNFHFREEVVEGHMVFDYRLRPGPCPTTNALKIMQLEGLPVESPDNTLYRDQKV